MATFFRWRIANKVIPFLENCTQNPKLSLPSIVSSFVKVNRHSRKEPQLNLLWSKIIKIAPEIESCITPLKLVKLLKNQGLPTSEGFLDIGVCDAPTGITFTVDKHVFSKIVLSDICANEESMKKSSCLFQDVTTKKVLVQYSLPTIGEMFSMTDFRNTIHSNFIANIHAFIGNEVVKLYTMADWSLQSALLLTGYNQFGIEKELLVNPVHHLTEVLKVASIQYENDLNFKNKVLTCFESMKKDKTFISSEWNYLRNLCLQQHQSFYKKLGINCDDIHFDSSCSSEVNSVYEDLLKKELISLNQNEVNIELPDENRFTQSFQSQTTNSYIFQLCSAIQSAIQAKEIHNFNAMYYVSSSSQEMFFSLLFSLIKKLGFEWSEQLHHVKLNNIPDFDSIRRKNISAEDILKKGKSLMFDNLKNDLHLESDENLEKVAEALSYASVHVFDMKHRRNMTYSLNWKEILHFGKDSGAAFQLCHAGLKGVQEETEFFFDVDIDTSPLLEPAAQRLILHLARFDEIVYKSYIRLEPVYIYQYLSSLWYFTDNAANCLKLDIKSDRLIVIKARLMLLSATLKIFQKSLGLLGLKPYVNEYTQPKFVKF